MRRHPFFYRSTERTEFSDNRQVPTSHFLGGGGEGGSYLGDVVKPAEELVEHGDQFLWGAGARQLGEAHDVCVQDAAQKPRAQSCFCPEMSM